IADARRSMIDAEVVIARRAVKEERGLVVVVNKMDLIKRKRTDTLYDKVMETVLLEIQTVIPQDENFGKTIKQWSLEIPAVLSFGRFSHVARTIDMGLTPDNAA
ncbi:hypothetical protein LINGRAHAP2_LOCUS10052, partial [Linum grandiflorum]